MLERMKDVLERIDKLNTSFRGMAHRRYNRDRDRQNFNDMLNQAQTRPVTSTHPSKPAPRLSAVSPFAAPSSVATIARVSPQYSDLIEKYAGLNGLSPQLVRKVIQTESNFDPKCLSRKGAQGLMQLMPGTSRDLGVEDPFDPEQNIAGGSRYLAMMLERFGGDMTKALAAYNAGPTEVENHDDVPPFPETRRFVAKVLGKNTDKY